MRQVLFAVTAAVCSMAYADFLNKPDDNTLWIENGANDLKSWRQSLKMEPIEGGGFTIEPGEHTDGGHYVPEDAAYPWLVGEITSIEHLTGYREINIVHSFNMVDNAMTGIFAVKRPPAQPKMSFLRIDCYGLRVGMKYLKQVKKPDYYIDVNKTDAGLEITVYLKDIAEDVSIRFYDAYCMPPLTFDNQNKLQLLPTDEENPIVWKGVIKDYTYKGKGRLMLKASILGGKLKTPLWGVVPKEMLKK